MGMMAVLGVQVRVRLLLAVGLIVAGAAANAQSAPTKMPEFEVATIKPISQGGMHMVSVKVSPGGRVVLQTQSLKSMICMAFDVSYWQVSGGYTELDKKYDVQAKAPELGAADAYNERYTNFGMADERLRQMLQALLIERFQLKFHRETRTGDVYVLQALRRKATSARTVSCAFELERRNIQCDRRNGVTKIASRRHDKCLRLEAFY